VVAKVLAPTEENLEIAAAELRSGGLVAFATETVYGLGALALDAQAVRRIFEAKGRPSTNPLIVHVLDRAMLLTLVDELTPMANALIDRFWPGPLTLVLPKRACVPDIVTAGGPTVAVRMPAHPLALALLRAVNAPIAAPSANRSTEISPTTAAHVLVSLGDRLRVILDGGPCERGIESTVLDVTGDEPRVLRPGSITRAQIADAVRGVSREPTEGAGAARSEAISEPIARSPGQQERHYAPRAIVKIVSGDELAEIVRDRDVQSDRRGLLLLDRSSHPTSLTNVIRLPITPEAYAARLYAALHDLDVRSDEIVIERPPNDASWEAIHDRLRRAATPAS
jgi:L-threonylcarbamoyladenylate synthase